MQWKTSWEKKKEILSLQQCDGIKGHDIKRNQLETEKQKLYFLLLFSPLTIHEN